MTKNNTCICGRKKFEVIIDYKKSIFRQYAGIVIGKCKKCGVLRTLRMNKKFNAEESEGEFYEENSDTFKEIFNPLIEKIKRVVKTGVVLDVGCSSGILMECLKDNGFTPYGIEPNGKAYKIAKKKFPMKVFNYTSKEFYAKNHKTFDVIIYNHVLEHINSPQEELKRVKNHLKKGGLLVISVPNKDNIIFSARKDRWESLMPQQHIWHFGTNSLASFLKRNNFKIDLVYFSNHNRKDYPVLKRIFFSFLNLVNFISGTGEAVTIFAISN